MSVIVTSAREIPDAPVYVLSNDRFMSGWGRAQGATNTVVVPCASYAEAQWVEHYAACVRTDQSRVRIVANKPRIRAGIVYSLMSREDAPAWYPAAGS